MWSALPDERRYGLTRQPGLGRTWASSPRKAPKRAASARRGRRNRPRCLEDYVELIADLLESEGEARPTDIARRLGVSHATAIKTISRLKRAGLATARPYRGRVPDRERP